MSSNHAKTHLTQVRTVSIPVTDQDRALEFYVGTLGFEKRVDTPFGAGERWIEVAPLGAETSLALVAATDDLPAGVETGIRLTTGNADADHAALPAAGVDAGPDVLRWGGGVPAMFVFRDPDGNTLRIVERS
ncbi:VOC family protein [Streptomyces sp. NPDC060064]|uniref:VOC family protein n=1 Tax=Streptomyces sp. NPDC060064 TaxID=3347049 RepID=UPI0036BC8DA8